MDGADGVYPSAEDTFLLIDALVADAKLLREVTSDSGTCIEIGYVAVRASQHLFSISSRAVRLTVSHVFTSGRSIL